MKDNNSDINDTQKFVIKTKQGDFVISWPCNQRTGFCPYCHKCIPLNSIVFKKENENSVETYSGMEAVEKKKDGRLNEESKDYNRQIGECPYCHKEIPVCEILIKKTGEEER
ncbi:hypothetical protein [Lacrimispora saccharolytica]|uniref:Uncharacterized protein n=1 Tax=Lacrimispora saccharolytica (strain ATCC 35040 / DSM 2544 / NRCC 2533 / WM1) TaxID=610130 RepID=D9R9I7_LACSW|nr:hypothetical protein [Lacrimispora saccharolytica]ADL04037.1 hypothetical protein Closa_1438 [[Clostridium] saccharolyticum WM1]QRV21664.1 hypothetical protein I6K70_09585 [Lacrimispora saccharolytica]